MLIVALVKKYLKAFIFAEFCETNLEEGNVEECSDSQTLKYCENNLLGQTLFSHVLYGHSDQGTEWGHHGQGNHRDNNPSILMCMSSGQLESNREGHNQFMDH